MANLTLTLICAAICLDAVRRLRMFYRAGTVDSLAFVLVLWALFYIGIPSTLFAYFGELGINGSMVRPQPDAFAIPLVFQVLLNVFLGNRHFAARRAPLVLGQRDTAAMAILLAAVTLTNLVSFVRVFQAVLASGAYELAGGEMRDAAYHALADTSLTFEHVARVVGLALTGVLLKSGRIKWTAMLCVAPIVMVDVITLGRYLTISALFMYVWARPEIVRSRLAVLLVFCATIVLFYYRTYLLHIAGDAGDDFVARSFVSTDRNTFEVLGEFINTYATFHMAIQAVGQFDFATQAANVFSYLLPPGGGGAFLDATGMRSVVEVTKSEMLRQFGAHPAHLSAVDLYFYSYFSVLIAFVPIAVTFVVSRARPHPVVGFISCYLFVLSFACLRGSVLYYYSRAAFVLAFFVIAFVVCRELVALVGRRTAVPVPSQPGSR